MESPAANAVDVDDEGLLRYFDSLRREDCYRVEAVLKQSPGEVTQRVSLIAADGRTQLPRIRKIIRRDGGFGGAYERIFAAQQTGARYKHVPIIWECYANDENLVVVMELVAGETLESAVQRMGPSLELARSAFPRLCDAATELHEEFDPPIIHRDLKPSNVILSQGGLVLIDFGIARELREGARTDTTRFGTRSYAPPEQFGFGQTTVRSDVYALGMLLFYCLAGTVPDTYIAEQDMEHMGIPDALRPVIARATALDPVNRYASARELKDAFLGAVERAGDPGNPVSPKSTGNAAEPSAASATNRETTRARVHKRSERIQPAASDGRFTRLGTAWNVILALVAVVLICACVASFISPTGANAAYPVWVNALGYLILLPAFFLAGIWMLADKRRLTSRFPRLGKYRFRHWAALFAITFAAMFFILGFSVQIATGA